MTPIQLCDFYFHISILAMLITFQTMRFIKKPSTPYDISFIIIFGR